jgi:vitamin B12 transporter
MIAQRCGFAAFLTVCCITSTTLADDDVEVVVAGSDVDRHASADSMAASTVLRRTDLESPGATSATVLTRVPGVQVQQTGSSSDLATASLRGTTSAQTPVYLAGIRLNDDLSGTADLSTIPLWMLDRIEVYRGNAPANAELPGIGGAVMFEPRYPAGNETRLGATIGSWGQQAFHVAQGQGSDKAQSLVALRHESARNEYTYFDNGGTAFWTPDDRWVKRSNADQTTTDGWVLGRVRSGDTGQVLLLANVFDREQGVPGLLAIPATHTRSHVRRELIGVSGRSAFACSKSVTCQLSSATSFQLASTTMTDPLGEFKLGAPIVVSDSRRVAQLTQLTWPLGTRWTVVPSASMSAENLNISGTSLASSDARRLQTTIGASIQWRPLQPLSVIGTARIDVESTRSSDQSTLNGLPIGRLGAAYEILVGLNILANAGYYNRVPTLGELYGTSAYVAGNPSLKPEHGFNRDMGVRFSKHGRDVALSLEAFVFQQDLDDLVAWRRTSFGQIRPYNVGAARLRGLESYWGLDLVSMFRLEFSTTLLDPRDVSVGRTLKNDILPFRSRLVTDARLEVHTSKPSRKMHIHRASISLRGSHRSSRYQDTAGLIIIPRSTTFDVEGAVTFAELPISLTTAVYNVANQPKFDTVGYPLAPRTFAIGANIDWERPQ